MPQKIAKEDYRGVGLPCAGLRTEASGRGVDQRSSKEIQGNPGKRSKIGAFGETEFTTDDTESTDTEFRKHLCPSVISVVKSLKVRGN